MMSALLAGVFYLDLVVSVHDKNDDIGLYRQGVEWKNGLGTVEAGYTLGKFTLFCAHTSSLQAYDRGLNQCGAKVRAIEW